ncbi:HD domain-containing protein [Brevibacillus sp. SYSU BS000544]|uniref:HD domain-containing protein n=1 Tax=Brevibacillus sp. SYSU BS000544 TaxID=3416443 RepID=UPI003CE59757
MTENRILQQIQFLTEVDKLKSVYRQSFLINKSRNENDAEHSWHLAMMAMILREHANEEVDVTHVMKLVLIHDIIEIDAGDTFAYDEKGYQDKEEREKAAADRIFSILPEDQTREIRQLWDEFEERATPEAKFAHSIDRLSPLIQNYYTEGATWRKHQVTRDMVIKRCGVIADGSKALWEFVEDLIRHSVEKGYLLP